MITGLYTYVATALVAAALASAGTWRVQEWRYGAQAAKRLEAQAQAQAAQQSDAIQLRRFNDTAAGAHARTVATLNTQLGAARAQLATLSPSPDRACFDAGTVGLLNNIGGPSAPPARTPAADPAGAAAAPAPDPPDALASGAGSGTGIRPGSGFASQRDTAQWIATCRAQYAQVADQLNQILDIEDRRSAAAAGQGD